jgi:hypothetical protein
VRAAAGAHPSHRDGCRHRRRSACNPRQHPRQQRSPSFDCHHSQASCRLSLSTGSPASSLLCLCLSAAAPSQARPPTHHLSSHHEGTLTSLPSTCPAAPPPDPAQPHSHPRRSQLVSSASLSSHLVNQPVGPLGGLLRANSLHPPSALSFRRINLTKPYSSRPRSLLPPVIVSLIISRLAAAVYVCDLVNITTTTTARLPRSPITSSLPQVSTSESWISRTQTFRLHDCTTAPRLFLWLGYHLLCALSLATDHRLGIDSRLFVLRLDDHVPEARPFHPRTLQEQCSPLPSAACTRLALRPSSSDRSVVSFKVPFEAHDAAFRTQIDHAITST